MRIPNALARDPSQAWRIALLTLIVVVVGCSRSKTPTTPQQPNSAAAPARDAAHREVDAVQAKLDEVVATLTKTEAELEATKSHLAAQTAKAEPDAALRDSLSKKIVATDTLITEQRSERDKLTKELTDRNLDLQKAEREVDSAHNAQNKR